MMAKSVLRYPVKYLHILPTDKTVILLVLDLVFKFLSQLTKLIDYNPREYLKENNQEYDTSC